MSEAAIRYRPPVVGAGPGTPVPAHPATALHTASGLLAAAVLADSAVEHYRGSFHNPAMYLPLASSALGLTASLSGHGRLSAYVTSGTIGVAGTAFHLYNIFKRPGGLSWLNLFYAAPFGAPAALALCPACSAGWAAAIWPAPAAASPP